jgi:hypothetical protein
MPSFHIIVAKKAPLKEWLQTYALLLIQFFEFLIKHVPYEKVQQVSRCCMGVNYICTLCPICIHNKQMCHRFRLYLITCIEI